MFRKIKLQHCLIFLTLFTAGCQKGCSYSDEIDSESTVISAGEKEFEIVARLYEHGNTRRSGKLYSCDITLLDANGISHKVAEIGDVDYDLDLNEKLNLAKARSSKDKFTYQIIYDGHVCATFHYLKEHLLESPYGLEYGESSKNDFTDMDFDLILQKGRGAYYASNPLEKNVDIEDFPSKDDFLKDLVMNSSVSGFYTSKPELKFLSSYLKEVKLSEEELITFFEDWPKNKLSKKYFTIDRINNLKTTNPSWYGFAQKHIASSYNHRTSDASTHKLIFDQLKDEEINWKLDSVYIVEELDGTLDWTADDFLFARLEDNSPLTSGLKEVVERKCAAAIDEFPVVFPKRAEADLDIAIKYYQMIGRKDMVKSAAEKLKKLPKVDPDDWKSTRKMDEYIDAAEKCKDYFEIADRKIIAQTYLDNINSFSVSDKKNVFDLCDGVVDCKVLMPIVAAYNKEEHGDNEFFHHKPKSCKK